MRLRVGVYLFIHAILMVIFAVRVIRHRQKFRISLGHGESPELLRAARVFGNHNEYTPFFLLMLVLMEYLNAPVYLLHSLGILFTAGRFSHAYAIYQTTGPVKARVFGMISTFFCLIVSGVYLLWHSF